MKSPWMWLRTKFRAKGAPARRCAAPRARLAVEVLEDRLVLTASPPALDYASWRQQIFSIDQLTVSNPSTQVTQASNPSTNAMQGSNLIGLDRVFANYPYRGNGYSVAVIDTGIDYNHADLGGGWGKRVIAGWDFANNDADPMDDNGHGTHVAGIIGGSSASYGGVAPNVNLIALKVLTSTGSGTFAAVEDALKWVVAHQEEYNIVAVNLSLGSGNFTVNPYAFLDDEFAALRSEGVFIAAASGNSFYANNSQQGLSVPAISPYAVSVGAVWAGNVGAVSWMDGAKDITTAADRVASFTQRSAALDLMAPGALITSTWIGGGYKTMAGTSMATPFVAGAAALLHQALDATGKHALANQDGILGILQSTGIAVIDGDDENDNVVNTGLSFKRIDLAAAFQSLGGIGNQAPTIDAIADQSQKVGQGNIVVTLSASDPENQPVTFGASVIAADSQAWQIRQQYGLFYAGSYYQNGWGGNEKWLLGTGGSYFLLPNGELHLGRTNIASSPLVATLSPAYYNDPSLLWNATAPGVPATVSVVGNRLTITPTSGFVGSFVVEVTASDGVATSRRSFNVSIVSNRPPVLNAIADQTVRAGQSATVSLSASDPDSDTLTYTARALGTSSQAYQLKQQYGLFFAGSYYQNGWGGNEKWMLGTGGTYFILPSGALYQARGTIANSTFIANVGAAYYNDPSLLWNASAPVAPATVSVSGNQLTVTPTSGFSGTFSVEVTVSDGRATATKTFNVTVGANRAPTLGTIANQTVNPGQSASVTLSASDADNDTLTLTARANATDAQAHQLKSQYGLFYAGSYYLNSWGSNEKWMLGSDGQAYFILPSGALYVGRTSIANSTLVATLSPAYYNDPSLLWNAAAPSVPATATIVGNQLTVTPRDGFLGSFTVEVTASDGITSTTRSFTVTVRSNSAPVLGTLPNVTARAGQSINVNLTACDADSDPLTFSARVIASGAGSQAYQLKQQYGLVYLGDYFTNSWGSNEKWLSNAAGQWFCILPNGEFRMWQGTMPETLSSAGLLANLGTAFYNDPSLLWNAQAPLNPGTATVSGNQLTLRLTSGYVGSFTVEVSVSDGSVTTTRTFTVTVS